MFPFSPDRRENPCELGFSSQDWNDGGNQCPLKMPKLSLLLFKKYWMPIRTFHYLPMKICFGHYPKF
jgi:hypothetical protein